MSRTEFITRGDCEPLGELAPGVVVRVMASGAQGAVGMTTCCVTIRPSAALPFHTHPTSEVITAMVGEIEVVVEGRRYLLGENDSIHIPAGVPHLVGNISSDSDAVVHASFPTQQPDREFVEDTFERIECEQPSGDCPETLRRFDKAEQYELSSNMSARDLFAGRFGSKGICGGYAIFYPGAELPCHTHRYDESITIVAGKATCQVAGQQYDLSNFDTACIPEGRPHRFINDGDEPMAMIWVYAGDEPDREIVDQDRCACS